MRTQLCWFAVAVMEVGCGLEPHTRFGATEGALTACEVPLPEGTTKVVASERGVAFGTHQDTADHVLRAQGTGCELTSSEPVIAGVLLDLDDRGAVYVLPREADAPGVIGTTQDDSPLSAMKVDATGVVSRVIGTGRGLWSFGVSPGGDTMWASACGPTGIFETASAGKVARLPAPDTLWEQRASVLTDDGTFWSVGVHQCGEAPVTPACAFGLVRTRGDGSRELGTTLLDFGAGYEEAELARCGHTVCGATPRGVVTWDEEGRLTKQWGLPELEAHEGERVTAVTGTDRGLYVTLEGPAGARLRFVPR